MSPTRVRQKNRQVRTTTKTRAEPRLTEDLDRLNDFEDQKKVIQSDKMEDKEKYFTFVKKQIDFDKFILNYKWISKIVNLKFDYD